jgi:VanZ family protein
MITIFRKLLDTRWPALLWTLLIFVLLTISTGSFEHVPMMGIPQLDKLIHAFLFAALVFLWWRFLTGKWTKMKYGPILLILFLSASAYGIGMEFYQKYFTSREFELGDIYADITGAAIAVLFCRFYKKISPYGNRGRNQN